ncbi:MAG: transglutaminase domain-containing protein [Planctomycetes bacterium]|nr:transglutaminase domain-containing protein [Planctomycetota bacterium]
MRRLFLMLLFISSVYPADAGGRLIPRQRREHLLTRRNASVQSKIIVEFDLSYDFSSPGETHRINFIVVLPKTIPDRQSILSIKYSPKPSRIFHKNGNRYAEFVFIKPSRQVEIEINIRAELFRYDLLTARKKRKKDRPQDYQFKAFLKQEKHIEKDHYQIQEIADGIEGQTEIDIVKNIYDYVIDNMEYTIRSSRRGRGAVKALQSGKGDCTEYADLLVAICRAKNIPASVVTGYTVGVDPTSSKHNWAEVYLQEYGWVPFDPSTGDIENAIIRDRAFGRMRPAYIYLSYIRNDEVLHNYNFSLYRYWGDRVRFKDSIEFK